MINYLINIFKRNAKHDYSITWSDLGIPQAVVKEHESSDLQLQDPPKELVERTLEALLKVRKDTP